jgi:hypothetical protein
MSQTKPLIDALKKELRRQGKTYRDVSVTLELSEASVKRMFSERNFSLARLDCICGWLGLEFSDLIRIMEQNVQLTSHLSLQQERELVSDIKLLLLAHFLISKWTFAEITETYDIPETEGIQLLARLDHMKIIQLLPGNRVKLMISRDFEWLRGGPIEQFYEGKVQSEFLDSSFSSPGDYRTFLSGMLTKSSSVELTRKLKRLAHQFIEASTDDTSSPMNERYGTSVLIAMRPWGLKKFESFRRGKL